MLIAVQNGMTVDDIRPLVGGRVGIFIGGNTPWKLRTLPEWGALGVERGCWVHVGRVNSMRRIIACSVGRAHSFDGTSVTQFPKTLTKLDRAVRTAKRQFVLF